MQDLYPFAEEFEEGAGLEDSYYDYEMDEGDFGETLFFSGLVVAVFEPPKTIFWTIPQNQGRGLPMTGLPMVRRTPAVHVHPQHVPTPPRQTLRVGDKERQPQTPNRFLIQTRRSLQVTTNLSSTVGLDCAQVLPMSL